MAAVTSVKTRVTNVPYTETVQYDWPFFKWYMRYKRTLSYS